MKQNEIRKGKRTMVRRMTAWLMAFAMMIAGMYIAPANQATVEAATTSLQHLYTDGYISELAASYDASSSSSAKQKLTNKGYKVIDYDLNDGVSGTAGYIYLGYKTTTDATQAITDVWADFGSVSSVADGTTQWVTGDNVNGITSANFNRGTSGSAVYLHYDKDLSKDSPICEITFANSSYTTDSHSDETSFNLGAGGNAKQIYMRHKHCYAYIDNSQDYDFDGKEHGIGIEPYYDSTKAYMRYVDASQGQFVSEEPMFLQPGTYTVSWVVAGYMGSAYTARYGMTTFTIRDAYDYTNYSKLEENLWLGAKNNVDGPVEGTDYTYSVTGGLKILSDKDMMLYNLGDTVLGCPITVASGVSANLSLRDVTVERSTQGAAISVNVAEGDTTTLTFHGDNTITAKGAYAGIQKNGSGKLVIKGTGTVDAKAGATEGFAAAGIGGGTGVSEVSNIEITGTVDVTATGSTPTNASYAKYGAAGIGSQYNVDASDIVINGATVKATGGVGAAGIGSGANGNCDNVSIKAGTVTATAGGVTGDGIGGAGIGSGAKLSETVTATNIQVSGGTVTATGGYNGAGIGSGSDANVDKIVVSGGTIANATGGAGAAGIGSGADGNASNISVSSGTISAANGGEEAAGIGSGKDGNVSNVSITGDASVTASSASTEGNGGAGIGSGANGAVENISINTTGTVTATAGKDAAGIGSGASTSANTVKDITIQNIGTITANGNGSGAGIGGGAGSSVKNIKIAGEEGETEGVLNANSTVTAIGAYDGDVDGIQILTDSKVVAGAKIGTNGTAKNITVIGDSIYGADEESIPTFGTLTDSLYIIRNQYGFYGKGTILKSCNVEAGTNMILGNDAKVIIPEGVTVTVDANDDDVEAATLGWSQNSNAELSINGTLDVKGSMTMNSTEGILVLNGTLQLVADALVFGTFYNHGTVSGNGKVKQGSTQTDYQGTKAVYMDMDVDDGVTYSCAGTKVNNQVIISGNDLDSTITGKYTISNIKAEDGYTISDILLDGISIMKDVVESEDGYSYTFVATDYMCQPGDDTSVTFSVRTTAKVKELVIDSQPEKLQYATGTELELTGLSVSKVYMNDKKETLDLTDSSLYEISGYDSETAGTKTITISYKGEDAYTENVSTTFTVTVFAFSGMSAKGSYLKQGENKIAPTSIDDDEHVITFALDENIGAIDELATQLTVSGNGWDTTVGTVLFDSKEGNGLYPTKAEYIVPVYLDMAKTISLDYKIVITQPEYQIDLSDATVTVSGDYTYKGEAIEPEAANISVVDEELEGIVDGNVVNPSYYTVSYTENVNAGTGSVTITGNGVNATGSATGTFAIGKATLTADKLAAETTHTLTNEKERTVTFSMDKIAGLSSTDYTVSFEKTEDESEVVRTLSADGAVTVYSGKTGTATVKMTVTVAEEAANYQAGEVSTDFTIELIQYVPATELSILQGESELPSITEGEDAGSYALEMYAGNERTLTAKMNEDANDSVSWTSEDTSIATVEDGVICAEKAGETTITVTTGSGISKKIKLAVAEKTPLTVSGTQSYEKVTTDESFTLDVTITNAGVTVEECQLTYESNNTNVATVGANGVVDVVGAGSATITVTATPIFGQAEEAYVAGTMTITITVSKPVVEPDPTTKPEATVKPDPTAQPEVTAKPDPTAQPEATVKPDPTAQPEVTAKPDPTAQPEVTAKPDSTAQPEATAKPDPTAQPEATAKPDPTAQPEATVKPDPTVQPNPTIQPEAPAQPEVPAQPGSAGQDQTGQQPNPVVPAEPTIQPQTTIQSTAKGTALKDKKTGATYKVTSANSGNPTVEYTSPKKGAKGAVTIPETVAINGVKYKVTSIAKNAFKKNTKITKVTIGSNVTKIGKSAFEGCKKLKTVIIKTSKLKASKVGAKAFKGIKSKVTIKVPKKQLKAYKSMLLKKGVSKKAKIKK